MIGASPWGRMLLIKCALVAGMVVIALVNRYVLVPRMSASGSRAESLILRTTQAERAGRAGAAGRQSVCHLGTLLN
jgi:putative copper resistance protein D